MTAAAGSRAAWSCREWQRLPRLAACRARFDVFCRRERDRDQSWVVGRFPVEGWLSASMVREWVPETAMYGEELEVARSLATRAGEEIVRIRSASGLGTVEKAGGQGPVTEADLSADRLICDGLRKAFPEDAIVSEEGDNGDASGGDREWYVDPLDLSLIHI